MRTETLIVSDVHLGSDVSLATELRLLLKSYVAGNHVGLKRLILLGDMFQDLNFSRLTKEQWKLVSLLRWLSNPKRGVEVVWVEGNHDAGIADVMEHLIGVKVYQEYEWEWKGKKCIAIHGHQYDNLWCDGHPFIAHLTTPLYLWMQKIDFLKKWLPRLLDKFHTMYERLDEKVRDGAVHHALREGAHVIFCGHTHQACSVVREGVEYWNTGDWVGEVGTYITQDERTLLNEFRTDRRNPNEERSGEHQEAADFAGCTDLSD